MVLRFISFLLLFAFTFSIVAEARTSHNPHHVAIKKQRVEKRSLKRKKQHVTIKRDRKSAITRKRQSHQGVVSRKQQHRNRPVAKRGKQTSLPQQAPIHPTLTPSPLPQQALEQPIFTSPPLPQQALTQSPLLQQALTQPPLPTTPFSLLNAYHKKNARLGGLDQLFERGLLGQGHHGRDLIVGVIEHSGVWGEMDDVRNHRTGNLPDQVRANYQRNFLPPLAGPGRDPHERNETIRATPYYSPNHGSRVASVVMDLAPQTKVLPVSTNRDRFHQPYSLLQALIDLSQRNDVNIINFSGGYADVATESQPNGHYADGTPRYSYKTIFTPQLIAAFQETARAGKVIVIAAGNEGKEMHPPEFTSHGRQEHSQVYHHLLENLDADTRQSIILAGNLDADTRTINAYSNKPGPTPEVQERFLFAPAGQVKISYLDNTINGGTSYAAPLVCAAIAGLCSKSSRITPRIAMNALLDSADRHPDVRTYGRGIIRADKALELLESQGY